MGKAPDLKRIVKEDFPAEFHQLIEKLAFPLNSHMEQVRSILGEVTQELITLKVQTNANSVPINRLNFKSSLRNKVRGVIVVSANITSSNTSFPQHAPFISFSQNLNIVSINNISGLAPETTYDLLLLTIS